MSETKFTRGPWFSCKGVGNYSAEVARINIRGKRKAIARIGPGSLNHDADAHLIAAAPTMYSMLEEARLQIEYLDAKFQPTGTSASVLARIEAALSKARGPASKGEGE